MLGRTEQQTSAGILSLTFAAIGSVMVFAAFAISGLGLLIFGGDIDAPGAGLMLYFLTLIGALLNLAGLLFGLGGLIQRQGSRFYASIGTSIGLITALFVFFFVIWPEVEFFYYCNHDYINEVPGCLTWFP